MSLTSTAVVACASEQRRQVLYVFIAIQLFLFHAKTLRLNTKGATNFASLRSFAPLREILWKVSRVYINYYIYLSKKLANESPLCSERNGCHCALQ